MSEFYQEAQFAQTYNDMVDREDYEGNLLPAIQKITPLKNEAVLELGAGTGRVSCLLAPYTRSLTLTDLSPTMLVQGINNLSKLASYNWQATLAVHQALPFVDGRFDCIISGWSFHGVILGFPNNWQAALDHALAGVARVLRPGGRVILIESVGTGFETPNPPDDLADYLDALDTRGFKSTWIRTDYCFSNMAEAKKLITFFFSDRDIPMWESDRGVIVPECTGLWWKSN